MEQPFTMFATPMDLTLATHTFEPNVLAQKPMHRAFLLSLFLA
ncbi:MAG: hypothetical protein ACI965_000727 [Paraglaciecola sp.]|jgi:hypothetical protein